MDSPAELASYSGRDALPDTSLIANLATLWAKVYRSSPVPAQRNNPLYADEQQGQREQQLRAELGAASARLVCLLQGEDLIGFFWGLSVADLGATNADKAEDVSRFVEHPAEQVAYLSMLGVHPDYARRGYGKLLTRELCAAFAARAYLAAIARTINENALSGVYQRLDFQVHERFSDPSAEGAERAIFSAALPLPPT